MMNLKGTTDLVTAAVTGAAPRGSTYYLITQNSAVRDAVTSLYCVTQDGISIRLRCADDRWEYVNPKEGYSVNPALTTDKIVETIGKGGAYNIDKSVLELGAGQIHLPVLFWGSISRERGFVVLKDKQELSVTSSISDDIMIGGNPLEDYAQEEHARHPESHQGNPIVQVLHGLNPEVGPQEWVSDDGIPWKEAASKVLQKERELQGAHDLKGVHCELLIDTMEEHEARWCSLGDVNTFYRFVTEEQQPEAYKQLKKTLDLAKYHSASIVGYGIGKGWPGDEVIEQRRMQQESNKPPPGSGSGGGFSPSPNSDHPLQGALPDSLGGGGPPSETSGSKGSHQISPGTGTPQKKSDKPPSDGGVKIDPGGTPATLMFYDPIRRGAIRDSLRDVVMVIKICNIK